MKIIEKNIEIVCSNCGKVILKTESNKTILDECCLKHGLTSQYRHCRDCCPES